MNNLERYNPNNRMPETVASRETSCKNPFREIEKQNLEKKAVADSYKRVVQRSIKQEFSQWDSLISSRLEQLAMALTPQDSAVFCSRMGRLFFRNDLIWRVFSKKPMYRIVRNRKEGTWALELASSSKLHVYSPHLVSIRFGLNEQHFPDSFHLDRGSDNQGFNTNSLDEHELTKILLAHFSRLGCGSSMEDDLAHLQDLREKKMLSDSDFCEEKKRLLSNRSGARLYILPQKPAHALMKRDARVRMLFVTVCTLLMAALLMCAYRSGRAEGGFEKGSSGKADSRLFQLIGQKAP